MIVVPSPRLLFTVRVPPASSARSRIEARPTRPLFRNSRLSSGSNPTPLSRISTRRVPDDVSSRTVTSVASACFFTFDRAS